MSACSATSRMDSAGITPGSSICASASRSLSKARTSCPDLAARLRHIGAPITPKPMNPSMPYSSFMTTSASTATAPSRLTMSGFASASRTGRPSISASREKAAIARASACRSPGGRPR